jgi:hypothetical protein
MAWYTIQLEWPWTALFLYVGQSLEADVLGLLGESDGQSACGLTVVNTRIRFTFRRQTNSMEKPQAAQLIKNFPTFYGTRKFVTVFTRVHTTPSYPPQDPS